MTIGSAAPSRSARSSRSRSCSSAARTPTSRCGSCSIRAGRSPCARRHRGDRGARGADRPAPDRRARAAASARALRGVAGRALDGCVLLAVPAAARERRRALDRGRRGARGGRERSGRERRGVPRGARARDHGAAIAAGLRSGLAPPAVRREEFAVERWPRALDGFRIVQISDIHIGPLLGREFAADLAQRVNALAPDLIAVTGDLVDGSAPRLAGEVAPFADLRARHGVFFVTGNHDHYSGAHALERGGAPARHARAAQRARGDRRVRRELRPRRRRRPPRALRRRRPRGPRARARGPRPGARRRAARPRSPPRSRARAREAIDLQLSGHTHGGQIWPFAWFVRLATPYVAGRYRDGRAQLYVSRGTGFWGPPLRLFSPAEITEITIRSQRSGSRAPVNGADIGVRPRISARSLVKVAFRRTDSSRRTRWELSWRSAAPIRTAATSRPG